MGKVVFLHIYIPKIHSVKNFEPNKEDVFSVKTFDQLNLEPR